MAKLYGGRKGRPQACPDWGLLAGGAVGRPTSSEALCVISVHIWLSLLGSQMEAGTKIRQADIF